MDDSSRNAPEQASTWSSWAPRGNSKSSDSSSRFQRPLANHRLPHSIAAAIGPALSSLFPVTLSGRKS